MNIKKPINILILLFTIIVLFLLNYFLFFSVKFEDSFLKSISSKRHKLDKIKNSKVVFTGDVNVTAGIETKIIERELGLPVVNMAVNSSIGYKKILSYVKRDLNKGDVLIFSPGYDVILEKGWNGLENHEILKENNLFPSNLFYKDNLNDSFYHSITCKNDEIINIDNPNFSEKTIIFLKKYHTFLKDKGVKFYISPTLIAEGIYTKGDALKFWNNLSEKSGISLLSENNVNFLNIEHVSCVSNIPNIKGRIIRSNQLINAIRAKKILKTNISYLIPKNLLKSSVSLANFNDFSAIEIIEKNDEAFTIAPLQSVNYFRIKHKGKNYTNYSFSIELECTKDILKNIKFTGTNVKDFDHVVDKGNGVFELFKDNMEDVYQKENQSSYIGISLSNVKSIKILSVGLSKMPSRFFSSGKIDVDLALGKNVSLVFRVLSPNKRFIVNEIFNSNVEKKLFLNTGNLYRLEITEGSVFIKEFYTGQNIYKEELTDNFKLKSYKHTIVEVFK